MAAGSSEQSSASANPAAATYEPPALTTLGTVAELTQVGNTAADELLSNGSAA